MKLSKYKEILIALLFVVMTSEGQGQSPLTVLTDLASPSVANPCGVILVDDTLYGATESGGNATQHKGTVFSVHTDGTGYTGIHAFTGGADGESPTSGLVLAGGALYGSTGDGVLFSITTNAVFSVLGNLQGGASTGPLAFSAGTLFATSYRQIYSQETDGSQFNLLHSFSPTSGSLGTNADGTWPFGGVVLSGNIVYGTTSQGGLYGQGTIFALNTIGNGFTNLYNFTGGSDGGFPTAPLTLSGNKLYGYAYQNTNGSVFSINTDGTDFTMLHTFGPGISLTVSELSSPPLTLVGNTLYGAVGSALFSMDTNGSNFTSLATIQLSGAVAVSSNTLYGSAYEGGAQAIVFALQLPTTPIITSEPTNLTVVVGRMASFSVATSGSMPLSYQWALNGTNIAGATGNTFTITNAFPVNSGSYTVTITNQYGYTNSTPATLTVIPVSIVSAGMSKGGSFQFSLPATANVNYEVQYSTNLTTWIPLVTFSAAGGLLTVTDPNPTVSSQRFYRVSVSPIVP